MDNKDGQQGQQGGFPSSEFASHSQRLFLQKFSFKNANIQENNFKLCKVHLTKRVLN